MAIVFAENPNGIAQADKPTCVCCDSFCVRHLTSLLHSRLESTLSCIQQFSPEFHFMTNTVVNREASR
jgi:hypothetical protein